MKTMRCAFLVMLLAAGCIDTDAAVFVEARIDETAASVEQSALATGLAGSFRMHFHLGPRASGQSEVGLSGFFVTDVHRVAIVDNLAVVTGQPFPVIVPVSGDVSVGAAFAAEDNLLEVEAIDVLCAPGGIRIVGVFHDPLRGGSIDATSEAFSPTGCP
jgi:hypothetical protein